MTTITTINVGSAPNAGDGDPLRTAFSSINNNFNNLNLEKIERYVDTSDPTANDDGANTSGNGTFTVPWIWVNTTTDTVFILTDNATGAAVWQQSSLSASEVSKLGFISVSQAVDLDSMETVTDAALVDGDFSTNGVMVRTAAGTYTNRSIADAGSNRVSVTNGDGVAGNVTLDVNEGNIDHDSLSGFVAAEHIDHTSVSITGGGILSGGGDISASRSITLNNSDIDHGGISGLADDDHTQYALLAGRSGGQTLTGGSDAGDDLSLVSTTNGTKGDITFNSLSLNSGSRYDETNDRFSVGGSENEITIAATTVGSRFTVHAEGSTDLADVTFERHSDNASFGTQTIYGRARGTHTTPSIVQDGDSISRLISVGYDGTDFGQVAEMRVEIDGTPGAGDMPGRFVWLVSADGSESPAEGMRLSASGLTVTDSVTATDYTGTLLTAAQPNITSVGTLANLNISDAGFLSWGDNTTRIEGSSATDTISLLTNGGVTGLSVDSSQNVSIPNGSLTVGGTGVFDADFNGANSAFRMDLSATDAELRATNTANSSFAQMTLDALNYSFRTATNERLVIDDSGNVGIGTDTPRSLAGFTSLGIDNTSGAFLDLFVNGTRQSTLSADATSVTLESATTLPFRVVTNGTAAVTVDSSQDVTMSSNLDISGEVELGSDQVNDSSISKVFTSAHQAGNQGTSIGIGLEDGGNISGMFVENVASTSSGFNSQEISFRTSQGNIVVSTERMRITQAGDVSIGISAPETRFHTSGGDANGWTSFTDNVNNNSRLKIGSRSTNLSAIQSVRIDTDANTDLTLQPLGGNIGVGTTLPDAKFHVFNGSAGTFTPGSSFDDTIIENSGSTGVTIVSPDADVSAIGFSSPGTTNDVGALVRWQYGTGGSTQQMILGTNSTSGGISLRTGSFVEAMNINSTRAISTGGESAPDVSAGGLCLNQGSEDGNIFTFKSSDVNHAMTGNAEADTYGVFRKGVAESGMLVIEGFSEVGQAVAVSGRGTSEDTSDDTSSRGTVVFSAAISDGGTGITDVSNTGNAFAWVNNNTARMLLKGNGDLHVTNTSLTALDNENDLMLSRNFQMATGGEGYKHTVSKEGMQQLKDLKILNEDGSMVNKQNESALLFGSISQIGNMLGFLADKLGISKEDLLTEAMNYDNTITY